MLASGPERIVTYCGAGAASSAAFALGLLDVDGVAVYDGSMLEFAPGGEWRPAIASFGLD